MDDSIAAISIQTGERRISLFPHFLLALSTFSDGVCVHAPLTVLARQPLPHTFTLVSNNHLPPFVKRGNGFLLLRDPWPHWDYDYASPGCASL